MFAFTSSRLRRRLPRLTTWLLISFALVVTIAAVSPVQLPVVIYKLSLVSLAAVAAYWLDRALFPYARPDGYLVEDWRDGCAPLPNFHPSQVRCASVKPCDIARSEPICGNQIPVIYGQVDFPIVPGYEQVFAWAMLRRAIVVAGVVVSVALGL